MKSGKSGIYKVGKKSFRYDYDNCLVEWITKAKAEDFELNKEWQEKYGKDFEKIDDKGYITIDAVGLRPENWKNKEARDEYLFEWIMDIDEEVSYML